jgi:hypothetical protein
MRYRLGPGIPLQSSDRLGEFDAVESYSVPMTYELAPAAS